MAGSVNQIKFIKLAVFCFVIKLNRMSLNCYSAFTLQIHIIQNLILHITLLNRFGKLQQSVRKSGLTVIYMSNY